jgi:hypothetical protein
MSNKTWIIKGGFSNAQKDIVVSADLAVWVQDIHKKNLSEKDPVVRALNYLKLAVDTTIIPENPIKDSDVKEIENFPFSKIQVQPSAGNQAINEIQQKLLSQSELNSTLDFKDEKEQAQLAKLLGVNVDQTKKFLQYIRGEISSF